MKYIFFRFVIIFLLFTPVCDLHAEGKEDFIQFTPIKEILNNMVKKYDKMKTYRADFKIKSVIDKVKITSEGKIKYRAPDTFIMLFSEPGDQLIFSDGKVLKLYIPELNVLGEQNLKDYRPGFLISGKTSLYYLRNKFDFSFHKSNKPVIKGGMPYYVLLLTQKEVTAGFKTIILYISQNWIITKVVATSLKGDEISMWFSDIVINKKISDQEFEFNLPINTQTIQNPLFYKLGGE